MAELLNKRRIATFRSFSFIWVEKIFRHMTLAPPKPRFGFFKAVALKKQLPQQLRPSRTVLAGNQRLYAAGVDNKRLRRNDTGLPAEATGKDENVTQCNITNKHGRKSSGSSKLKIRGQGIPQPAILGLFFLQI